MQKLRSFLLFGCVGLAAAGSYFATLYLLESVWLWDYRIAASCSYVISAVVHFGLNRQLTFRVRDSAGMGGQAMRYLVLLVMNYLINLATVVACVELWGWSTAQGVALSMVFTLAAGYVLARSWVFAGVNGTLDGRRAL